MVFSPKTIPLRYCPLVLEFEIVNDPNDPIIWPGVAQPGMPNPLDFYDEICSNEWLISQIQLKCDLVTLDNGLENEYFKHLLAGNLYKLIMIPTFLKCKLSVITTSHAMSQEV